MTAAAGLLTTAVEAFLLQRKHSLFTGGFLAVGPLGTWADGAAFLLVVLLLNLTVIAPLCALMLTAGTAVGLRPRALRFAAVAAAAAPLLAADFLMYGLWSYLGDAFDINLMYELTGRRASELFAAAAPVMTRPLFLGMPLLALLLGATWVIHRLQSAPAGAPVHVPPARSVLRSCAALLMVSAAVTGALTLSSDAMVHGLRRTPAGELALQALNRLTDVDGDGYGVLENPRDPAAFNAAVHPYALEIPGNGVDENGVAGDLRVDRVFHENTAPATVRWASRPAVVLVVLESFRADAVGATYGGRPVTPTLDALARQGVQVNSAWSHNGFTRQSRFHILSGSLTGRGGTSLVDDFKNNGYDVAYFSGQDDSAFGSGLINYDRVDKYYDARQDVARRYSSYTTPGSLAVPARVLEDHILEYLDARRSTDPLFLYVNFHDTHYPYTYDGLPNLLLGGDLLTPSLISPSRRGDLWRTYLNAAANVDAAVGRVIAAVRRHVGSDPAVIVVSDHGESLFEGGFLGHGYALNPVQTRIPMVVAGLPMRIRVPFGQAALRDALNEALSGRVAMTVRPWVETTSDGRVFQYLGPLDTPGAIGWLRSDGEFTFDFRTNQVRLWEATLDPGALVGRPQRDFVDLVNTWESLQLALAEESCRASRSATGPACHSDTTVRSPPEADR